MHFFAATPNHFWSIGQDFAPQGSGNLTA